MKNNLKQGKKELLFQDIVNIIKEYKWSIIFITLLSVIISYVYVYFKPSIYISHSIIKVKTNEKSKTEDVINNTILTSNSKDVLEEISLLKTYKINSHSLENVNFKIQYFIKKNYKGIELYGDNLPIDITKIKILNKKIIGKLLTLTPTKNGYDISYDISYKDKIKKILFDSKEFSFQKLKNNKFSETIKNKYFELTIQKKENIELSQPIYFLLRGQKRDIFEKLIHNRLTVQQLEKDTALIKISFQDNIPERANQYIDALTESFIKYSIESKNIQNSKTLDFITQELQNIKKELKNSEERLETHQVSQNIVNPSIEAGLYIKNLSNIEIEISRNKLKKKLITNLIDFIQNNYNLDAIAPSVAKLDDQNTLSLISKLQNKQIIEKELTLEYTNEYPELISVRNQIDTIRKQIEYNLKSLRTNIDYENINLLKRKVSYEESMQTLPSKERELVNIKRNYEVKSKMYEYLLQKQAENKIIQLATFSNYQIIDRAYNSNIAIKPKRSLILIFSLFLGFIIGSLLAFYRYSKNNFIKSKNDIERYTSLPIYGSIPFFKQKKNKIHVHGEAKSPFTEAFRTLRTNLQFVSNKQEATTILITSTIAGEGKSTISANLSTILEMAKYKTIVLNFDLRKPSLHKFFDVNNDKGLSGFLSGKNTMDEIIIPTEFANLDIIPSGPIHKEPSELILSKELPLLIEKLRSIYEYIIIDTAPIGIVSDTKTLLQYSDLNLIIIREDYAKREFINTLEEMIEKYDFKKIGLILNASKSKGGEYGYGYSYAYKY